MILSDSQREELTAEITEAINGNYRTRVLFEENIKEGLSDLLGMCWNDYNEQSDVFLCRRPFYTEDERGTFGYMRLRDDNGRVLGYDGDGGDDLTDSHYDPSPADKRRISSIMESGTPLYYYVGFELANYLGVVLKEYTRQAVYEYERKRHRLFDLTVQGENNSAPYIALYKSYFSQYGKIYDLPTLTAGTEARKGYYTRLIERVRKGEVTLSQIRHFPHGRGLHPKTWKNELIENDAVDFSPMVVRKAEAYNSYVHLNGVEDFPHSEDDIDMTRMDGGLFWQAVR